MFIHVKYEQSAVLKDCNAIHNDDRVAKNLTSNERCCLLEGIQLIADSADSSVAIVITLYKTSRQVRTMFMVVISDTFVN